MIRHAARRLLWRVYPRVYDRLWDTPLTAELAALALAELPIGHAVEEVGAGTGLITRRLVDGGFEVHASEPEAEMRRRLAMRLPHLSIHPGDIASLPVPDNTARCVLAANVLHLAPDPAEALARLRARTGPDGRVVVLTPVPTAGVLRVAREIRRAGATRTSALGFVVVHLLLAPVVAVARPAPSGARAIAADAGLALHSSTHRGVARVLVFTGTRQPAARCRFPSLQG